jgi:hypothetical protein
MSDDSHIETEVLGRDGLTLDDLFLDMSRTESMLVRRQLRAVPTDVALIEGAGALADASAYLRFAAEQHAGPGSPEADRMLELADQLEVNAARFQRAGDTASIAVRTAGDGQRHDDVRPTPDTLGS